jgi:energy-coupling factor transport system permease protein
VNITARYLGQGSPLARCDPRTLLLVGLLAVPIVIQNWDIRIALALFVVAALYYRQARIPFRAVRRQWAFVVTFLSILILFNTILTGGQVAEATSGHSVIFYLPILGTPITAEALSYGATQMVRFLTISAAGFPIAYAIAPSLLGTALARMRLPEKFAYAVDLTMRFIPSLAAEMHATMDAQRIRGYEFEGRGRNPVTRFRRQIPIVVPVTINAIVNAEDTIDAMDLRAFGTSRRTWIHELRFERRDAFYLGIAIALLAVMTFLSFTGRTGLYVIPFLLDLAGA